MIEPSEMPRIGLDFWFMREEEEGLNPIIIIVDKQTKCHISYPVESKSVSDWIVKRLCDDLESFWIPGQRCNDQMRR